MSNSTALDRARAAKPQAQAIFSKLADVVGIGIATVDGDYGLKINLRSTPPATVTLPKEVAGVPVRIEVVGNIRKQSAK